MTSVLANDAERMDRHYRYQRHIYDATRTYYLIGRRHLIEALQPSKGETVLEIGCGTAWNLARAARRYPEARFFGTDVSNAMLDTARGSLEWRGLADRIVLRQGDATRFDPNESFGVPSFDRVFFSYALSMIPDWREALDRGAAAVGEGGSLHIVDFGQCGALPLMFKRALDAFLAHYTVYPRTDLMAAVNETAVRHGLTATYQPLHRGYTDYAVLRRD